MGNRGSTTQTVAKVSTNPSSKEIKKAPSKKTPHPSTAPTRKSLPKSIPEKEKTVRRGEQTTVSIEKKKDDGVDRTAKEIKRESTKKRSNKKSKSSGKYVDGVLVSAEGTKKKSSTVRSSNKTSSVERKKGMEGKKSVSERSKRKYTKREEPVERSTEQTADENTQDSSARRKKMRTKSVEKGRSTEEVTKTTEQTEKTKDEKTVPTFEDDNTLVSDAPKRKKYKEKEKEENVKEFIKVVLGKGVNGLKEEFNQLKKEDIPLKKDEKVDAYSEYLQANNSSKNRYKDVPRLNESKVTLKGRSDEQSYIHANYCTTPKGDKRFICTQGPNEKTHNDFWWMVCQEEVEFIVMLCNFVEMGKPKCDKYLPMEEGEILSTDDFKIQCMAVHGHKWPETVTIRKLIVTAKEGEKEYSVQHLHWESWPDRGVPPIDLSLFKLLERVGKSSKPIVVHCSAGIGRTGTTVVVQIAMEMLNEGQSLTQGIAPIVKKLRKQRAFSVQTENQYIFIHRLLLEYFKDVIDDEETTQFRSDYHKLTK